LKKSILRDANTYRFAVFPVAKESVEHAKDYMDYFIVLDKHHVLTIAEELIGGAHECHKLISICADMHTAMNSHFKRHQDRMDKILSKFELQKRHLDEKIENLRKRARTKENWALGLAFIPGVSLIATPILAKQADAYYKEAQAAQEEKQLIVNATHVLRAVLATALSNYVEAMNIYASTFQLIAGEIKGFMKNLHNYRETEKDAFFLMCSVKGKAVKQACEIYISKVTDAEANLMSLPETSEKNYVQEWLAEHNFKDLLAPFVRTLPALKPLLR